MTVSYIEFAKEYIEKQDIGIPIYSTDISNYMAEKYGISLKKSKSAVSVVLNRIMKGNLIPELRFYKNGIYFRTAMTAFGEVTINKEKLIEDKYLKNDSGYETGLTLLHKLGLTSQMPNKRTIATNRAKDCARYDKRLGLVVQPPKIIINAANKQYLEILDVLDSLDDAPIDADEPYKIIGNCIGSLNLQYDILLALANNHYNRKTVLHLAHVAGECL